MRYSIDPTDPITIQPEEAALFLLAWLEQSGAVVQLDTAQQLRVNLDPLPDMTMQKADRLSRLICSVRDELRALLIVRGARSCKVH